MSKDVVMMIETSFGYLPDRAGFWRRAARDLAKSGRGRSVVLRRRMRGIPLMAAFVNGIYRQDILVYDQIAVRLFEALGAASGFPACPVEGGFVFTDTRDDAQGRRASYDFVIKPNTPEACAVRDPDDRAARHRWRVRRPAMWSKAAAR
jgi:hypothetical protein